MRRLCSGIKRFSEVILIRNFLKILGFIGVRKTSAHLAFSGFCNKNIRICIRSRIKIKTPCFRIQFPVSKNSVERAVKTVYFKFII
jgi:hypothetical protein